LVIHSMHHRLFHVKDENTPCLPACQEHKRVYNSY
jgi:hypothetical protein